MAVAEAAQPAAAQAEATAQPEAADQPVAAVVQGPDLNQAHPIQQPVSMSLWQGYIFGWKKYIVFRGRARRKEYWGWTLFNAVLAFGFSIIDYIFDLVDNFEDFGPLWSLYFLAAFLPGITVTVRRLHDTNRRGWPGIVLCSAVGIFTLVNIFDPSIADIVYWDASSIGLVLAALVIMVFSIPLFIFCCRDSTLGENRFGPNPKEKT